MVTPDVTTSAWPEHLVDVVCPTSTGHLVRSMGLSRPLKPSRNDAMVQTYLVWATTCYKKYGHLSHHATTTPMRPGYPQLATGRFGRPTARVARLCYCANRLSFALQSSANEAIFCELLGFNRVNGPRIIGGSPRRIFRFQIRENVRLRFTRSPGSRAPGPAGFF